MNLFQERTTGGTVDDLPGDSMVECIEDIDLYKAAHPEQLFEDVPNNSEPLLEWASKNSVGLFRHLIEKYHSTTVYYSTSNLLRVACCGGCLYNVKHLVETLGLTVEDVRADDNSALRWACYHGHVIVVKYLVETFGLTADDARANNNSALRKSREKGHLRVVNYLIDTFGLTSADVD